MKKLVLTVACIASLSTVYGISLPSFSTPVLNEVCTVDSVNLNQYAGKYKFTGLPFEYITIGVKDGQLTVNTGTEEGVLTPVKEATDKYDASGRATLQFTRDADKKVIGITLEAQGMTFDGKKEA
jgi:hypothetical protein